MVMRYHWGFAVGHTYCNTSVPQHESATAQPFGEETTNGRTDVEPENDDDMTHADAVIDVEPLEAAELTDNQDSGEDDDSWDDSMWDSSTHGSDKEDLDDISDQELLDLDDMYGDSQYVEAYD